MDIITKKLSVNPSSFNELSGTTVNAQYSNQCLRYLSVRHILREKLPRTDIHPIYQAIGVIGEERFFAKYPEFEREVPFEFPITEGVVLRGRADGVGENIIAEIKTTINSTTRSKVIKKGELPSTYLGQLLTYLYVFKKTQGLISVSYVHFNRAATVLDFETREFKILVDEDRRVFVDGVLQVEDLNWHVMSFYTLLAHYIESNELAPMPITDKPCNNCVLSDICKFDLKSKEQLVEKINMAEMEGEKNNFNPKIKNHNTRA